MRRDTILFCCTMLFCHALPGRRVCNPARPPPPLCPRARFWFKGQKVPKHGVLDRHVLPCGTYHGTHVADISQNPPSKHDNPKQQAGTHQRTQEHMELQPHQHCATHSDLSCSLHKATNRILYRIGTTKTMVPKQTQKCGNKGSPCWDKPTLGQEVGSGSVTCCACVSFRTVNSVTQSPRCTVPHYSISWLPSGMTVTYTRSTVQIPDGVRARRRYSL